MGDLDMIVGIGAILVVVAVWISAMGEQNLK